MMYKVQLTLVTGPLVLQEIFIPMANHESESTYISLDNTRISKKTFSVPLGFGGYLLTIDVGPCGKKCKDLFCEIDLVYTKGQHDVRWPTFP